MIVRSGFSPLPIAFAVILSVIFAVSANAATVTIAWDPSPDQNVIGYRVYVGTSPGSYAETFDVGLARSFTYSPGDESVHYFAVAAYAVGPVVGPLSREVASRPVIDATSYWSSLWEMRAEAMQLARQLLEASAPTVSITVPTSQNSYSTDQSFVALAGTAKDDGAITEVTWTTDRGYKGRATGTENWIAGVPLRGGANTITVRARDNAGRVTTEVIVVNLARNLRFTR